MGFWAVAAPIAGSILGGIMNRGNKRPQAPPPSQEYLWQQRNSPQMLDQLKGEANRLITNPYGLGDVKQRLMTTARDTATASYASSQSEIARQAKLSGLDPAGGQATRQQYYAGEQMAQGLNQAYTGVELQDFLAREEQKNRGLNLMLALSKSNPALAQIASHNYWNEVAMWQDDRNQINNLIGGITQGVVEWDQDRDYNQRGGGQIWDRPAYGGPGGIPAEEVGNFAYSDPYSDFWTRPR